MFGNKVRNVAIFHYKAKNSSGKTIEGRIEAHDHFAVAQQLRAEGYMLLAYKEQKRATVGSWARHLLFGHVSSGEKMLFARNLAVMVASGLPLPRALDVLVRQTHSRALRNATVALKEMVQKGQPLNAGMKAYPKIFSSFFCHMVAAGEESGKLEGSLKLIAEQLERKHELYQKVRGALIYPAIVVLAMVGIGIFMLMAIVPSIVSSFADFAVDLPLSTRIIVALSDSLIAHSFVILFVLFLLALLTAWYVRQPRGKKMVDRILLSLPAIGDIVRKANTARMARTLSSLLRSGVTVTRAFEVTAGVLGNVYFRDALKNASVLVGRGDRIASAFLTQGRIFPPLVGEMVEVGEETGRLNDMLLDLAEFFEGEVSAYTKNLSTIIEPVLMIAVGATVAFFAVSMIQPMYSITSGL